MKYALVKSGQIVKKQDFALESDVPVLHPYKGKWVAVATEEIPSSFNNMIHDLTWTVTISDSSVNESVTVTDKDLHSVKTTLLRDLHRNTKDDCLLEYPEWRQINALVPGRMTQEAAQAVSAGVDAHRAAYHLKEAAINAATDVQSALSAFEA